MREPTGHFTAQLLITSIIALAALIVGLFVRMQGLGTWPFEVDEYYLAKATRSIIDNGLPNFDCGGFYTRGLLQQYVSAGALQLFDNSELAMRLYPMACNIAALWVALLLGRRLGGTVVGLLSLTLMSLSLWEIEFARFARMYAPFQLLTLLQVYLFVRVVFDGRHSALKWMILICLIGIVTYEVAAFLLLPVFVAMFRVSALRRPAALAATGIVASFAVIWVSVPFRTLGVQQTPLPSDLTAMLAGRSSGLVDLPQLGHVGQLAEHPGWLVLFLILVVGAVAYSAANLRGSDSVTRLAAVCALACFGLSMVPFGMVIFLAVSFLLQTDADRQRSLRCLVRVLLPAAAALLLFWGLFLVVELGLPLKPAAKVLLKYPNLLDPIIYVFAAAVPVLSVVLLGPIAVFFFLVLWRGARNDEEFLCLTALSASFLVGVALIDSTYYETRYSFFVYPLVLCLFSLAVMRLAAATPGSGRHAGVVMPVLAVAAFVMTEDFDPSHYRRIDSAELNFRMVYPLALQEHFKFRDDNRSPAEYVNARLGAEDTVIIAESGVDMYVSRVDFRYKHAAGADFGNHITCGLEHDVWSDAAVIYSEEQLRDVIDAARGSVWIIKRNFVAPLWLQQHEVFVGSDGRMQVLKVPARQQTVSGGST